MPESRKKLKKRKAPVSLILVITFVVMACYFFYELFDLNAEIRAKQAAIDNLAVQYEQQSEENKDLQLMLDNWEDNMEKYVISRARDEDLGYAFPNERIYYEPR